MKINISKQELNSLYDRAEEHYYECIRSKDNAFLKQELPELYTSIKLKYSSVKIVFSQKETGKYVFEITLSLWSDSAKLVGEYMYFEDEKGKGLDDRLVFF